ncbi:g551 [Coccomyxa viridis]|uniref:G551 protein n=1 Tax=Coccomyxa viridis TaxID=1274662 RepID=A0ABP1FG50_9CHLO
MLYSSRPLIIAAGGDGSSSEYELAAVYYQILNRRAADSAAYITVDVTVTAKADQPWLWGLQSAVEAIFIAQAKDDILAFLEYCLRLFKELHRTMQLPSQQKLRASRSRPSATPRGAIPGGAPDRRSSPPTPRASKHVSSGPTLTAALPQHWGAEAATMKAVREERAVSAGFEAARVSDTWQTPGPSMSQGALTPRYAKPEARSRRAPKTARPANGVPPSRVLYERPSSPSAVEWEIPPVSAFAVGPAATGRSPASTPLRDLIPDPEHTPDTSDSTGPSSGEAHHEVWEANDQQMPQQPHRTPRRPQRAERVAQKPPEQGRYYIIMPADAAATHEPPRVLEEICTEGDEAGGRRFLALREVAPHTAREYVSVHQSQRQAPPTAQRRTSNGQMRRQQRETRAAIPAKRVTFPEAPHTPFQGSPRQSHLPSSPEEEQHAQVQQRQRSGKLRGSQTARGESSHAVSESRKEMAVTKQSVQDTLRRVSAEMAQSEAQRSTAQKSHSAQSERKTAKMRNWFMQLFKGDSKGS